jgi:hypothetical protein
MQEKESSTTTTLSPRPSSTTHKTEKRVAFTTKEEAACSPRIFSRDLDLLMEEQAAVIFFIHEEKIPPRLFSICSTHYNYPNHAADERIRDWMKKQKICVFQKFCMI